MGSATNVWVNWVSSFASGEPSWENLGQVEGTLVKLDQKLGIFHHTLIALARPIIHNLLKTNDCIVA